MIEDMNMYKLVPMVAPGDMPLHRRILFILLACNAGDLDLIRGSQLNEIFSGGEGSRRTYRTLLRTKDIRQEIRWTAVSSAPRQGKQKAPSPGSSQQSVAKTSSPNREQEDVKPCAEVKEVLETPPKNIKVSCSPSLCPAPSFPGIMPVRG